MWYRLLDSHTRSRYICFAIVSPSAPAWMGINAGTNAAAATTDARIKARLDPETRDRVKLTSWPSSDAYEVSCRVRARVSPGSPCLDRRKELHPKDACRRPENLWVPRSRQSGVFGCDGRRWRDSAYGGRQTRFPRPEIRLPDR